MGIRSKIGIAIDSDLLKRFNRLIGQRGYTNRYEAFRDLIRSQLATERTVPPDAAVAGAITLIYDHHASGITEKLTDAQREHRELAVSTSHAHLVHGSCLEVLIVHGKSGRVQIA
jgi:CopG family nickel-responsive transcriptional regulator